MTVGGRAFFRRGRYRGWVATAAAAVAAVTTAIVALWSTEAPDSATVGRSLVPTDTARPTAPQRAASNLPRRVVAGYWQGWGDPALRLNRVPRAYNVIMAAFAVGDGSGRVRFSQSVQTPASFTADVDALNRAGRRVLLSVGGWDDGGLQITNDAQKAAFLRSVTRIIDTYHFQGIDWDLEHGIDPAQVADATFTLKAKYGPRFLITMAPGLDSRLEREQLDLAARIKDVLDIANIQFYNQAELTPQFVVSRTLAWGNVLGPDQVGMGFMTVRTPTDTGIQTPDGVCAMWRNLVRQAPTARGVMTWSINLDSTSGYQFARTCAPAVRNAR
ncbi:MAG: glycosyl hydrolase family 18 protein [Frankiaceae bacterium]